MILKELIIENYLCYYDVKKFEFATGLNVILGENGEGKTKFYEAIDWLFKGDSLHLNQLISAKKLFEIAIDETFRVRVSLTAEQYGHTKILTRQFSVKKIGDNDCEVSKPTFEAVEENQSGERTQVDASRMLELLFPATVRRYSMFKGEESLDVFKQSETLVALIHAFSDAKYFDKYENKGKYLKNEAEQAVDAAARSATRNRAHYTQLENTIRGLEDRRSREKTFLDATRAEITKLQESIADVTNYVANASALETINRRITDLREKIDMSNAHIDENYTTALFDEKWLLLNFEGIHKEFAKKITKLSIQRRELQSEHDREIGIKIGERRERIKLLNDVLPLPLTVPSKAIMEEMLRDEICKVCNTPAPIGSEAYLFMAERLQEYIETQKPQIESEEDEKLLFKNNYTTRLVNLVTAHEDNLSSIREINQSIKDRFLFNERQRKTIEKLNADLETELQNRTTILGNSLLSESRLVDALKNYNGWQNDLLKAQKEESTHADELQKIENELKAKKEEKDRIDIETTSNFLIKTREILRDIFKIFKDTRESKLHEFVEHLQQLSNEYLRKINIGSFMGEIVFALNVDAHPERVTIELQENGMTVHRPNQSLNTSMHIAILFAISKLASDKNEEGYPLIFDAPTSSFGEAKTGAFLGMVNETGNQIILLSKDFVLKDHLSDQVTIKPEFGNVKRSKAFWVKLVRPFDPLSLRTINTEVITL
jgi:DNA sulfur modification protein DndD